MEYERNEDEAYEDARDQELEQRDLEGMVAVLTDSGFVEWLDREEGVTPIGFLTNTERRMIEENPKVDPFEILESLEGLEVS